MPPVDHLELQALVLNRQELLHVPEQQVGALVGSGPAREADGEGIAIHACAGLLVDVGQQRLLGAAMRIPDFQLLDAQRVAQAGVVDAPAGNVAVEQLAQGRRRPGERGTPLVIESILYWANMWRETSPCFFATPLMKRLLSRAR